MKFTAIFLSACLGVIAPGLFSKKGINQDPPALAGKVTDENTHEPLIGATVQVLFDGKQIAGTATNMDGEYKIDSLAPGNYSIKVSFTGYESRRFTDFLIEKSKNARLDVSLKAGVMLDEVVVVGRSSTKRKESAPTSTALTLRSEAIKEVAAGKATADKKSKTSPAKTDDALMSKPTAPPPAPSGMSAEFSAEPAAAPSETLGDDGKITIDGIKYRPEIVFESETYEEKIRLVRDDADGVPDSKDLEDEIAPAPPEPKAPRAGLLTAGEWNDLNNWGKHWADLLADGEIEPFQKQWKCAPKNRFTFLLTNKNDYPLIDATVKLFDEKGGLIWETRTDNTGKAECWAGFFDGKMPASLVAQVIFDGKIKELGQPIPFEKGLNRHSLKFECGAPKNVDIVFAVDATGSMGDEIRYLQTELVDVLGRVQSANPEIALHTGSVFYRDVTDEYVVKASGLSSDISKTVDYIKKQSADGGGDWPEAVHSALEEVVFQQKWSEKAIARICFLVLDASPHNNDAVKMSLQKSIAEAAKKGIRIVPVVASGIQKETEWLMKFMDMATNGSYVFLTDHSGIGGKHLEPTTDEYKVEPLNDLLVRIISEYAAVKSCDGKSEIRFQNDGQNQNEPPAKAVFYPNPASSQFQVELPFEADALTLYNAEGQAVRSVKKPGTGTQTVQVSDLPEGMYTIRILKGNQWQSGKVMVVRS